MDPRHVPLGEIPLQSPPQTLKNQPSDLDRETRTMNTAYKLRTVCLCPCLSMFLCASLCGSFRVCLRVKTDGEPALYESMSAQTLDPKPETRNPKP